MSHFLVGIILPSCRIDEDGEVIHLINDVTQKTYRAFEEKSWTATEIKNRIAEVIEKYDENMEVSEYEEDCWCFDRDKDEHPNDSCDDCSGTGRAKTTYNPDSKWGWWRVGGRYDGVISGVGNDGDGFNFDERHEYIKNNIITTDELIKKKEVKGFALVTPNGEWIERGKMGWWACVSDEKDEGDWEKEKLEIIKKYPHHIVVGIDCHI